ncbi:antennal protein 10 isoform X2 [Haematobia irritans]|uniref:antennal protein 10 isoform X2 n=1 Tax=Haematobia irritans TaxID=7368 RepID=UPI003F4F767F
MKFLLIICISIVGIFSFGYALPHPPTTAAPVKSTYDSRFDNIDVDEILQQERLLKNYVKCLEGTGPCTPDGKALKDFSNFRDSTGRNSDRLRQMYGETEIRFGQSDSLPYRQSTRGLGTFGENLRSRGYISQGVSGREGATDRGYNVYTTTY